MNRLSVEKIAIGTTKLGMPYGAIDPQQVNHAMSEKIFRECRLLGFDMYDTAPSYGEAESLIGQYVCETSISQTPSKVVTKVIKIQSKIIDDHAISAVQLAFERSLINMQRSSCYGLLVHDVSDLYKPNADKLVKWMSSLRKQGKVKKIGVSVYSVAEAQDLYDRFDFDLIQLPCNIYDQRFISADVVSILSKKNVEIHARSLFLKGVILKSNIGLAISSELVDHNVRFHAAMKKYNISAYDACLAFAKDQSAIDRWVVGVSTKEQLQQISKSLIVDDRMLSSINFGQWAFSDSDLLDPRRW